MARVEYNVYENAFNFTDKYILSLCEYMFVFTCVCMQT